VKTRTKVIGGSLVAGVMIVGGYVAIRVEQEKAVRTPQAPLTDIEPTQNHAQTIPVPQVSTRSESLPQSQSTMVSSPLRKDRSSNTLSGDH
jgi:hypothetical protein